MNPCGQPRSSLDYVTAGSFPLPTSASLGSSPQVQTPKSSPLNSLLAKLGLSLHPREHNWQQRQHLTEATLGTAAPTGDSPWSIYKLARGPISLVSSSMNLSALSSGNCVLLSFQNNHPIIIIYCFLLQQEPRRRISPSSALLQNLSQTKTKPVWSLQPNIVKNVEYITFPHQSGTASANLFLSPLLDLAAAFGL